MGYIHDYPSKLGMASLTDGPIRSGQPWKSLIRCFGHFKQGVPWILGPGT